MERDELIKAALAVAKTGLPVFPTTGKRPAWSNSAAAKALDREIGRGEGGYKLATTKPAEIQILFERGTEIAVPMGSMSGMICIDVDAYKNEELTAWMQANVEWLRHARMHTTRSHGYHFFFRHRDDVRWPATLREGVDIKSEGGYVCWPPTEGYTLHTAVVGDVTAFPLDVLRQAMKDKGGTGAVSVGESAAGVADDELLRRVLSAEELYPALRALAFRLTGEGSDIDAERAVEILEGMMADSVAADPGHDRHDDWLERRTKIPELVESAVAKHTDPPVSAEAVAAMEHASRFFAERIRPIGPQRETVAADIEQRLEADPDGDDEDDGFTLYSIDGLMDTKLPPIQWVIPGMIPAASTVSLGGSSNVGKTRWLAGLAVALAVGDTERMGLPQVVEPVTVLWVANEERRDDIARRLKSCGLQHGDSGSLPIIVRGKDDGMMRLVAINEAGNPEIDEKAVAAIVRAARRHRAKVIILDPYITLSDAMDENSATSAAMLTKAFILISTMTGAAVLHAHHTPKNRQLDADWYRGDSGAWRGSGAIYSALDCAYTLAHWMPRNKDERANWKAKFLEERLSRWIVLDTGKMREGEPLRPIYYELVGQEMESGEGMPIGVCRLAEENEMADSALRSGTARTAAVTLARAIWLTVGVSDWDNMGKLHKKMHGNPNWPRPSALRPEHNEEHFALLEGGVRFEDDGRHFKVEMFKVSTVGRNNKWRISVTETGQDDE